MTTLVTEKKNTRYKHCITANTRRAQPTVAFAISFFLICGTHWRLGGLLDVFTLTEKAPSIVS